MEDGLFRGNVREGIMDVGWLADSFLINYNKNIFSDLFKKKGAKQ